jgi:hypothetical protein
MSKHRIITGQSQAYEQGIVAPRLLAQVSSNWMCESAIKRNDVNYNCEHTVFHRQSFPQSPNQTV